MPTRTIGLRITTDHGDNPIFNAAITRLTEFAADIAQDGLDGTLHIDTIPDGPAEHPERDALLALADQWRETAAGVLRAGDPDREDGAAAYNIASCADQLIRLVATLNL